MSAPCSSGREKTGVPKTLSTTTWAPTRWASSETAAMSTSSCIGLLGVSKNTAVVGRSSAASHWARSGPSTKTVSTPQRGRISSRMTKQDPNRAREATTLDPWPHSAARATNTADIPEAVAKQAGAPSSSRSRSSNTATVGLP